MYKDNYDPVAIRALAGLPVKRRPDGHIQSHPLIVSDPGVMGGRPVFRGTRVPVEVLFENLADELSLDEILDSYPTLDRADCETAVEQCRIASAGTSHQVHASG